MKSDKNKWVGKTNNLLEKIKYKNKEKLCSEVLNLEDLMVKTLSSRKFLNLDHL